MWRSEAMVSKRINQVGVFLSHNSVDKAFCRKIADDLGCFGVQTWVDELEIKVGDSLVDKIRSGIDRMDFLLVILTPESVASEWVKKELDIAMNQEIENRRVKVLPLLLRDCELPGFLKGKKYADFRQGESYSSALREVLDALGVEAAPQGILRYAPGRVPTVRERRSPPVQPQFISRPDSAGSKRLKEDVEKWLGDDDVVDAELSANGLPDVCDWGSTQTEGKRVKQPVTCDVEDAARDLDLGPTGFPNITDWSSG